MLRVLAKNTNFVHQMLDKISQMIYFYFWTQKGTLNFDQKLNGPVLNAWWGVTHAHVWCICAWLEMKVVGFHLGLRWPFICGIMMQPVCWRALACPKQVWEGHQIYLIYLLMQLMETSKGKLGRGTSCKMIPSQMEVAPPHRTVDIRQKRRLFKTQKRLKTY